ncbi:MAG: LiaI-LiaF-like domain-containing protein [Bacillota bacterium]
MTGRLVNGLVLVVVGAILLMNTSGYLPWSVWDSAVSFWPILVIGLGLQLLSTRWRIPWFAVAAIVILILGAMFPHGGWGGSWRRTNGIQWEYRGPSWRPLENSKDYSVPLRPSVSRLKVELSAPSLEIEARGDSGLNNLESPHAMTARITWDRYEPSTSWHDVGDEARVSVRAPDLSGSQTGKQVWDLNLNSSLPTSINVTGGVANATLDCGLVYLDNVDISAGVVDLDLTLGLTGKDTRVTVSGGAASVDVSLPRAAGLRVSLSSPLTITRDFDDQGLTRSGNVWVTPDYEEASTRVDLVVNCGAGKVKVQRTE